MEDANEDKDKGYVDEKVGRQVGKHGLSQVARAMTPPPFRAWPTVECSVQISSIYSNLETQYISIRNTTE